MLSKWVLRDLEEFYTGGVWTLERGGREGGEAVLKGTCQSYTKSLLLICSTQKPLFAL